MEFRQIIVKLIKSIADWCISRKIPLNGGKSMIVYAIAWYRQAKKSLLELLLNKIYVAIWQHYFAKKRKRRIKWINTRLFLLVNQQGAIVFCYFFCNSLLLFYIMSIY